MKEQLISFETARVAKNSGLSLCVIEGCKYYSEDGKIHNSIYRASKCVYYAAPTQSLLQKWLRDTHNIDVQPYLIEEQKNGLSQEQKPEEKQYSFKLYSRGVLGFTSAFETYFSYEKALETGLYRALQLIKN